MHEKLRKIHMLLTQFPLKVAAYVIHILSFLFIWLGLFYELGDST